MYSLLMSDCADRAVSEPWDGAATAACGNAAETVTDSDTLATLSRTGTSCAPPAASTMPLRRTRSNPGTATSTV